MKSLQYSNDSQQSVKIGDTDTTIKLLFNKDNQVVDLTAASSINLKVADSQHAYIKTVSIDISNQSDLANGYLTVDLSDALISGLSSGAYYFEIWVNIDNETEIYPDSGFKSFVIKNNIEQGSSSYTTITLNDISAKLTETANTLQANVEQSIKDEIANGDFKGDKGEPGNGISSIVTTYANSASGTVTPPITLIDDNGVTSNNPVWQSTIPSFDTNNPFLWLNQHIVSTDGTSLDFQMVSNLSNATAQQALSQVQGMNLGYYLKTNLLMNSSSAWTQGGWTVTNSSGSLSYSFNNAANRIRTFTPILVLPNAQYTMSHIDITYNLSWIELDINGNLVATGPWVNSSTYTFTTSNTTAQVYVVQSYKNGTSLNINNVTQSKLEKGSVATDWCPNPSEILTTANYNKLVAAIVALGGSI